MTNTTHLSDLSNPVGETLEDRIQAAIAQARQLCELEGSQSSSCAVAWDIVEELQSECAHRRWAATHNKTTLQRYCDQHPDADECRLYNV